MLSITLQESCYEACLPEMETQPLLTEDKLKLSKVRRMKVSQDSSLKKNLVSEAKFVHFDTLSLVNATW